MTWVFFYYDCAIFFYIYSLAHCVLETAVKDAEEVGGFIFACLANLALECADFKCGNIF